MTEKRFIIPENYRCIQDNLTKEHYLCEDKTEAINLAYLLNELSEENEQLRKELKDYHNAFDCSQCKYQNYDWFDDGDEFEVCDKGNNEAQMDNHSCKDWEEL